MKSDQPLRLRRAAALQAVPVFVLVLACALLLVSQAGSDAPWWDQWDAEGRSLYPAAAAGKVGWEQLSTPHNEHRIFWTQLLNWGLFLAAGQWDPLLQMAVGSVLRGLVAAALFFALVRGTHVSRTWLIFAVSVAFSPLLAWHNVLWGFQTQVYFAALFSLLSIAGFSSPGASLAPRVLGATAAFAGLWAMAGVAVIPVVLGIGVLWKWWLSGRSAPFPWIDLLLAGTLFAFAWVLRVHVPGHESLQPDSVKEFVAVLLNVLSWPLPEQPIAAAVFNLPGLFFMWTKARERSPSSFAETVALMLLLWGWLTALSIAWSRGGSPELAGGVPSRYVDFVVLLPLANAWSLSWLLSNRTCTATCRVVAACWGGMLFLCWSAHSLQVWRGVLVHRVADRTAPVRMLRAYQERGDVRIFVGQPRWLLPHPNLATVKEVLSDLGSRGQLPPSLQPGQRPAALCRGIRRILGHREDSRVSPSAQTFNRQAGAGNPPDGFGETSPSR